MSKRLMLFVGCLFAGSFATASSLEGNWELKSSDLTYHVHFVLKEVSGTSHKAVGKGKCNTEKCNFLIAVPVKTFDSGDSNRDLHMLETTKGALHPMVVVKIAVDAKPVESQTTAEVEVEFAGQKKVFKNHKINAQISGSILKASGELPIQLTSFSVERPSLLGVEIKDQVEVNYQLEFAKK